MLTVSRHAEDRLAERFSRAEREAIVTAADRAAVLYPGHSVAVECMTVAARGDRSYFGTSNGDRVWAIVRAGTVETVMLRRSSQPANRGAFGVEFIVR